MIIVYLIISFWIWLLIWYVTYYYRYEEVKSINVLRKNFKENKEKLHEFELENEELSSQNDILRDECIKLKEKSKDYQDIISDINIYIHRIKEWWEKARELADLLWVYDEDIEDKLDNLNWEDQDSIENESNLEHHDEAKKFF